MSAPLQVRIYVLNKKHAQLPLYTTYRAAGMDLHAAIEEPIILAPGDRELVSTGIVLEIPEGYEGQIRPRSGLAANFGITVLNSPGTIDADYRGEVKVILANLGHDAYQIRPDDRIAQLVVAPVSRVLWIEVQERADLSSTDRGRSGCGSTGR